MTDGMILSVLSQEKYPTRFEKFCIELFSKFDGVTYIETSSNYDLNQDGRQPTLFQTDVFPRLCISLNSKVGIKVASDIRQLVSKLPVNSIRFCTNQPLTEHKIKEIDGSLTKEFPKVKFTIEGLEQIANIAKSHGSYRDIVEKYYPGELAEQRAAIATQNYSDEQAMSGMKMALAAQLNVDGATIKICYYEIWFFLLW